MLAKSKDSYQKRKDIMGTTVFIDSGERYVIVTFAEDESYLNTRAGN